MMEAFFLQLLFALSATVALYAAIKVDLKRMNNEHERAPAPARQHLCAATETETRGVARLESELWRKVNRQAGDRDQGQYEPLPFTGYEAEHRPHGSRGPVPAVSRDRVHDTIGRV
jgi:hypothetical protein